MDRCPRTALLAMLTESQREALLRVESEMLTNPGQFENHQPLVRVEKDKKDPPHVR
jgi:hypothetical protein